MLPVADVDRAKAFYEALGWRLDADFPIAADYRIVQFTPPNSPASIQFGIGMTTAAPGSVQNLLLVVEDVEAARGELTSHGAQVSDVFHGAGQNPDRRVPGPDPERGSYKSFATFADPDGNTWLLQEVTQRLPGRVWPTDVGAWPTSCTRRPTITARSRRWPHRMTGGTGMRRTWTPASAAAPRTRRPRPPGVTWRTSSTSSSDPATPAVVTDAAGTRRR